MIVPHTGFPSPVKLYCRVSSCVSIGHIIGRLPNITGYAIFDPDVQIVSIGPSSVAFPTGM